MEAAAYTKAWILYLCAGVCFMALFWYFSRRYFQRDLAYLCQGLMAAFIFTPWYVYADQDYLAPALMVMMMDIITIAPSEGIRALIPLIMGVFIALLVTAARSIVARVIDRRRRFSQELH